MNVSSFSFDSARFTRECENFNRADGYIGKVIAEAHKGGKIAITEVLAALSACKVPFSSALANSIRVTAFRARKAFNAEFTITVSSRGDKFEFCLARSADIQRASGAGRKPAAKPASTTNNDADVSRAHSQRDTAIASAKHLADALRVLGFSDADLSAIGNGKMKPAAIRAHALAKLSPTLPAARKRSAAAPAALAA